MRATSVACSWVSSPDSCSTWPSIGPLILGPQTTVPARTKATCCPTLSAVSWANCRAESSVMVIWTTWTPVSGLR